MRDRQRTPATHPSGEMFHLARQETIEERLLRRAVRDPATNCLVWQGALESGYGYVQYPGMQRRHSAHRVAYEVWVGPIPRGLTIDHLCKNRACIEPTHLEPVTQRVNLLRGATFQAANARKTRCLRGHSLLADGDVYITPSGGRQCRVCMRVRYAKRTR